MSNIIDHPIRQRRIAEAKSNIFQGISDLRSVLSHLARENWEQLLTAAIVYELDTPGSGVALVRAALARRSVDAGHGNEAA